MAILNCLPPVINADSRVLVLGTMPGERSLQKKQYYANPGNQFWRLIYGLFGLLPDPDYLARISFVLNTGIALWDVLSSCERDGSSDSKIRGGEVNDFSDLILRYHGVICFAFSSQRAYRLFVSHVSPGLREIETGHIKLLPLPSPSGQNARMSFETKLKAWREIIYYL